MDDAWGRVTASTDQTLAALRENEYAIMHFRDAAKEFAEGLLECGLTRVEVSNIIHGIGLAIIFPDDA